eukprot:CAMPEP_0118901480 /NCGR_PEP_ID=MMETSP1166-20130328/7166_1 /TAXON_ID=1104430 /ORGANISM="Chrysoreinhardia sp, Strain CCMP3193" /LENGTH=334 /DNA_ID=CAMNT_0006840655 /DNA_START=13 /DNA_END=1017 /DNA_ORIENTATION=-
MASVASPGKVATESSELSEKLKTYSEQLSQVEGLLEKDASNEQLLKLRQDLVEVTKLTEDLIKYKAKDAPPEEAEEQAKEEEEAEEVAVRKFEVGMRCEALYGEKWYPAVITKIDDDDDYVVVFIGFGNTPETVARDGLRPLVCPHETLDASTLAVGAECSARYSGDGKYYDAVVDEVTDFGYKVTFSDYGNTEELPLEYLRDREVVADDDNEMTRGADGTYTIPEHLRVHPSDSEAERIRKRRRVKALKHQIKVKEKDQHRDAKQANWQTFQNKGAKRKVAGSLKQLRKESIFKAPDEVDGKVGVVGSGRGTTEYGGDRKKQFKFKDATPDYW